MPSHLLAYWLLRENLIRGELHATFEGVDRADRHAVPNETIMILLIALTESVTLEHRNTFRIATVRTHEKSAIGTGSESFLTDSPSGALREIRVETDKVDEITGDAMTQDPRKACADRLHQRIAGLCDAGA